MAIENVLIILIWLSEIMSSEWKNNEFAHFKLSELVNMISYLLNGHFHREIHRTVQLPIVTF